MNEEPRNWKSKLIKITTLSKNKQTKIKQLKQQEKQQQRETQKNYQYNAYWSWRFLWRNNDTCRRHDRMTSLKKISLLSPHFL